MMPLATLILDDVRHPLAWLVLTAIGAAMLFATYRRIHARTGRPLAWGLLALRGAGVGALILALAKPTWTSDRETIDPPQLGVIVDDSASMSLPDASGEPRIAVAAKGVERLRSALAKLPGPAVAIDLFNLRGEPLGSGVPKAEAGRTDLNRPVTLVAAKLRSRPLAGLVLVSDGMDNSGRTGPGELADLGVPVHTLGFRPVGGDAATHFAIRRVQVPTRAMIHNAVKVELVVAKTGGPARAGPATVRLGREVIATEPIDWPAGDSERTVGLTFTPDRAGRFVFSAGVDASDNLATFPMRVDREPIRVLYVEGFLRFEYKYLKARLEDDPDVSLVAVVRRANPEQAGAQDPGIIITPDRLKTIDVVILGDMEGGYLGKPEYAAILTWLDAANHAVLVLGGPHSFGPDGFAGTPLAAALPVRFRAATTQADEPFTLERTEQGRRHPIFELSGDRVKDDATWSGAPTLAGSSVVAGAKPGADILAVNPGVKVDGAPAVVVASQRFGGGRTMVLLADTTWRWSRLTRVLGQDDTLFARFWGQTIRWLAGRSRDDARAPLIATTDRPSYTIGQPARIRVERQALPGVDLRAEVVSGAKSTAVAVAAGSADPDVFTGTFVPSSAGRHEVQVTATSGGKVVANTSAEFLVEGADLERADPGVNRETLRAIGAATGGSSFLVDEADRLAPLIERRERRITTSRRDELWHSPWLFAGFIAAVSAEWFLRRRNHLV